MNTFVLTWGVILLWAVRTLIALLFHTALWQRKEYRFDRLYSHLLSPTGRQLWLSSPNAIKLLVLILLFPEMMAGHLLLVASAFFLVYALEIISELITVSHKGLIRPVATIRSVAIVVVAAGLISGAVLLAASHFPNSPVFLGILLLNDFLLPLIVTILILLSGGAVALLQERVIKKAAQKRQQLGRLTVIGVTGSWGKTSVKEFLSVILATRFAVVKTEEHVNTAIGVAQTLLQQVGPQHEIFIVEMGAYRRGEIAKICRITRPQIGIITEIGDQHLELFGSVEELAQAKLELTNSLPADGLAVVNLDSKLLRVHADKIKVPLLRYSVEQQTDVYARDIVVAPEALQFTAVVGREVCDMHAGLLGRQNIACLLPAIAVAHHLGMPLQEIAEAILAISPLTHTMEPIRHASGALFIDDSYSASSGSTRAALRYLHELHNVYKIFVFDSIIELGETATQVHQELGLTIAEICDAAVIVTTDHFSAIKDGFTKEPTGRCSLSLFTDPRRAAALIGKHLDKNTVVVFEGRGTKHVLHYLE